MTRGASEEQLYKAAVEVLAKLHQEKAPDVLAPGLPLFAYDEIALIAETDLMLEWFLPLALGRNATEAEYREHRAFGARRSTPSAAANACSCIAIITPRI